MEETTQKLLDRMSSLETKLESQVLTGKVSENVSSELEERLPSAEDTTGFIRWWHNGVNLRGGNRLVYGSSPLRASRVTVYAEDVKYKVRDGPSGFIYRPTGFGGSANSSFKYPGLHIYGIVMTQPGTPFRQNIIGTSPSTAQTFNISNGKDIFVNINDNDRDTAYGDNWGAYNIILRIDQP